jgi:16S rRNA (cytidine1402-2'-O)-methyltransferase
VSGRLYVVGTPLGNLEDLSPRAARVLSSVALVAAEDTRTAQKLFARIGISPPTTSYFEGNEASRSANLIERLQSGDDIALISEAGMPGVSDPGQRLIAAAAEAGIPIEVVPGPSAAITALVGSGLPTDRFSFIGFLPRESGKRQSIIAGLRQREETLIFYEAPNRVPETLSDLAASLGAHRRACVARELTKLHEEFIRGSLEQLNQRFANEPPRGEVTLIVEGANPEEQSAPSIDIESEIDRRLTAGESPKEIAAALALITGKPRRQIYQLAITRKGK